MSRGTVIYDSEGAYGDANLNEHLKTLPPVRRAEAEALLKHLSEIAVANQRDLYNAWEHVKAGDIPAATIDVDAYFARADGDEEVVRRKLEQNFDIAVNIKANETQTHRAVATQLLARIGLLISMQKNGITQEQANHIATLTRDRHAARWQQATDEARARDPQLAFVDQPYVDSWVLLLLAAKYAREEEHNEVGAAACEAAARDFFDTCILTAHEAADYAPGVTDVYQRVLIGAPRYDAMTLTQRKVWTTDLDTFVAKAQRHEYPKALVEKVREVVNELEMAAHQKVSRLGREIGSLQRTINRYDRGSAQIEAVEQQWACYRFVKSIVPRQVGGDKIIGAMQPPTAAALEVAETYCWEGVTTEAVALIGAEMPGDCALTRTALGDFAAPGTAGWWWFQQPIPVQTTDRPGDVDPVVALLWRREVHPERGPLVWFSTMVLDTVTANGRQSSLPIPTAAWRWMDGYALSALPEFLTEGFGSAVAWEGADSAGVAKTAETAVWFSRFFLAATTWLRQRIVVPAAAQGVRQVTRNLQREHKLADTPRVRIVELRRAERQMVSRARSIGEAPPDPTGRHLHVRFVVGGAMGFTRNQWYPLRNEHAPKWIAPYWKGPEDAPVKVGPRVYAVRR